MNQKQLVEILPSDVLEQMFEWIYKHKFKNLDELYVTFLKSKLNGNTNKSFCDWFTKRYEE